MQGTFATIVHRMILEFMLLGVMARNIRENKMMRSWHNSARILSSRYCVMYSGLMSRERFFLSKVLTEGT